MSADRLIFVRDEYGRGRKYYAAFDGKRGRACIGPKSRAVRLTPPMAETVLRQLAALDAREWKLGQDVPGKRTVEL
jgi:hypothetical protein